MEQEGKAVLIGHVVQNDLFLHAVVEDGIAQVDFCAEGVFVGQGLPLTRGMTIVVSVICPGAAVLGIATIATLRSPRDRVIPSV